MANITVTFSSTAPPALAGRKNVEWQSDGANNPHISASVALATTLVEGLVKLAGDFSGTYLLPVVAKIQGTAIKAGMAPAAGDVLTWNAGASRWENLPPVITEDEISLSDVTTNNASTTKHGFLKKLPNDSSLFLDGTGAFSTPGGGGSSGITTQRVKRTTWGAPNGVNDVASSACVGDTVSTTSVFDSWLDPDGSHGGGTRFGGFAADTFGGWMGHPIYRMSYNPECSLVAWLDRTSDVRWYAGLSDTTIAGFANDDTGSGQNYAMFRFSSFASDTNFQCVVRNASSGPTIVDSGIAADTLSHRFSILVVSSTSVAFYIDGTLVATIATDLPADSVKMRVGSLGNWHTTGTTTHGITSFFVQSQA